MQLVQQLIAAKADVTAPITEVTSAEDRVVVQALCQGPGRLLSTLCASTRIHSRPNFTLSLVA